MQERLVIRNFGPIKSVDLNLGRMTILIGEQATGKSTIAKVLAVCRYFSYIADRFENDDSYFSIGLENWGISEYIKENSYIEYSSYHYDLICKAKYGDFDPWLDREITKKPYFDLQLISKTEQFKELIHEYNNIRKRQFNLNIPIYFYQERIGSILSNPFFIPTERGLQSIFSLGKNSIQNLSDSLFVQFAKLDQISKSFIGEEVKIDPLNIYFKNVNGDGKIRKENEEEYYSLSKSASGYQSLIPIVLVIKHYNNRKKSKTFITEEPEINLFPKAQKKLVEFFVESMNSFNHQFLLPTHSPYVLSSVNNLMYAYKVANEFNAKEEVKKIVDNKYWVNPNNVEAYLLSNGNSISLIDKEEGLINIDFLDNVSEIINETFDKLLSIEISKTKEIDND
ncbi:AAA family ATPase [Chryseobacterium gambrini]|uniref:AAA family ATPase n=2 Tax=Chryseobacterium gambrini TaxID=373672 RepID=A0ABM8K6H4_9FLAO|nr:AAA family ATPase [Chryseobacterium gambrini]